MVSYPQNFCGYVRIDQNFINVVCELLNTTTAKGSATPHAFKNAFS